MGALMIVQKPVSRVPILLHVVLHVVHRQCAVQPAGGVGLRAIPGAIAPHNRTGAGQEALSALGDTAVIDARRRESVPLGEEQRKPTPHAEAITPVVPVQPSDAASQVRAASRSSKTGPLRALASRMIVRMQPSQLLPR